MNPLRAPSFLLALALSTPAIAQPKNAPEKGSTQRVAIMDLRTMQDNTELALTLTDLIAFELDAAGYKVITREDIKNALKLKGVQQAAGCDSDACAADLGQAVEADRMVTGAVGRLGSKFVMVLKLMDTKNVNILRQAKEVSPADEDALFGAVTNTARVIAGVAPPNSKAEVVPFEPPRPEPKADAVVKPDPAPAKADPPAKKADPVAKKDDPLPPDAMVVNRNDAADASARYVKTISKPFPGELGKVLKPLVMVWDEEENVKAALGSAKAAPGEKALTRDDESALSKKLAARLVKLKASKKARK